MSDARRTRRLVQDPRQQRAQRTSSSSATQQIYHSLTPDQEHAVLEIFEANRNMTPRLLAGWAQGQFNLSHPPPTAAMKLITEQATPATKKRRRQYRSSELKKVMLLWLQEHEKQESTITVGMIFEKSKQMIRLIEAVFPTKSGARPLTVSYQWARQFRKKYDKAGLSNQGIESSRLILREESALFLSDQELIKQALTSLPNGHEDLWNAVDDINDAGDQSDFQEEEDEHSKIEEAEDQRPMDEETTKNMGEEDRALFVNDEDLDRNIVWRGRMSSVAGNKFQPPSFTSSSSGLSDLAAMDFNTSLDGIGRTAIVGGNEANDECSTSRRAAFKRSNSQISTLACMKLASGEIKPGSSKAYPIEVESDPEYGDLNIDTPVTTTLR
ncbi:hypothetical protein BGZ58_004344, partial [Dissophora ornata]